MKCISHMVKSTNLILLLWLYSPLLGFGRFFSILILYRVGRTPWTGEQPVARPLPAHRTTQTQNKCTQYRHPCLEWDSNPRSQRAKTIHALDRGATVIGSTNLTRLEKSLSRNSDTFFLICIVVGGIKVYSTLRPLNGLLCQPWVIMIMEKSVE
jgi:hypothetical protein